MFIEFNVTNFRSFFEKQVFSMSKATGGEHSATNAFTVNIANRFELLRSAAIYGPNAGGKSNLLLALRTMRDIVRTSASTQTAGDSIPVEPFTLNPAAASMPSEFEVTFIAQGVRYQYGFSATKKKIHEEWLLAYPKGRAQQWFARSWIEEENRYSWEIGSALLGEKQLWEKSTRDNALFLSTAVQLNSDQLKPVYDWFGNTLRLGNFRDWTPTFSASQCEKSEEKQKLLEFLKAADLDIEDVQVASEDFDATFLPDDMPGPLKELLVEKMDGEKMYEIRTFHKDVEGQLVSFEFDSESDGTKKLFSFAGPWLDTLKNGYVLFIDELHDNLHPKLVSFLVDLFHNEQTNPKNAQLVFTTHETSILSQEVFRRDQVWFCEKGKDKSTSLFPLTDFSPRKGRENLEASYLSGRYGALPYPRPLNLVS